MGRVAGRALLVALLVLGGWAAVRWPRLDTVETGRTPEYPSLQPREYSASEAEVGRAVREALDGLGWSVVGSGRGRGGSEVQATARGRVLPFPHEVSVHTRRAGGRTLVSVRSRSSRLPWDFGENARLIERFQAALDAKMAGRGGRGASSVSAPRSSPRHSGGPAQRGGRSGK